jgi:hypothetical protein
MTNTCRLFWTQAKVNLCDVSRHLYSCASQYIPGLSGVVLEHEFHIIHEPGSAVYFLPLCKGTTTDQRPKALMDDPQFRLDIRSTYYPVSLLNVYRLIGELGLKSESRWSARGWNGIDMYSSP